METVEKILAGETNNNPDKLIIVSQWRSFLHAIARCLDINQPNVKYSIFSGQVAVKDRQVTKVTIFVLLFYFRFLLSSSFQEIINKFNNPNSKIKILLLSLSAGGQGLNLTGANHLLLVDNHWNPQLEAQAQDRIYRLGQSKNVYLYKLVFCTYLNGICY